MLTIYVLPHERASNVLVGISDLYMSRLFHQQWDLFAPEPPVDSYESAYILFQNKTVLDTIYPFRDARNDHLKCRSLSATKDIYMERRLVINNGKNINTSHIGRRPNGFQALALQYYCLAHASFFYSGGALRFEVIGFRNGVEELHLISSSID